MEYIKFVAGLAILVFSGKYLVQGGVSLARYFKISTLVIGVTVVAFGTSAPELIVSINAAVSGNPEIAFGNVIGSNISNIGLVLAITALLIPIPVHKNSLRLDWPMMMLACSLLYIFILDDNLAYYEGIILFVILLAYLYFLITKSRKEHVPETSEAEQDKQYKLWVSIVLIAVSSLGLAFGADFLVDGATDIASSWGVSKRVISITIVAFGTSVPELTASIMAAAKKQTDISIGNIIGSNIFNIMTVLGITSMVKDIPVDHLAFSFDIIWMLFIAVLLFLFIYPFKTVFLNRVEGALLLLAYAIYMSLVILGYDFESIGNTISHLIYD